MKLHRFLAEIGDSFIPKDREDFSTIQGEFEELHDSGEIETVKPKFLNYDIWIHSPFGSRENLYITDNNKVVGKTILNFGGKVLAGLIPFRRDALFLKRMDFVLIK